MASVELSLFRLYLPLLGWVGLGVLLGYTLPKAIPNLLGKFLFWIGVPISVMGFLRSADLTGPIWIAPLVAWTAILLGVGLARLWSQHFWPSPLWTAPDARSPHNLDRPTPASAAPRAAQGSFLLSSMVGNTGYLGYPVILTLVGPQYFAWALFYDLLGTMLGAYGLGVAIASRYGTADRSSGHTLHTLLYNPTLWSFGLGLLLQPVRLPVLLDHSLKAGAWGCISLSLVLIGMRLSQLRSGRSLGRASISLSIKMLVVPLLLGGAISLLGLRGLPRLIMVLQMAMPPAFATLVITEAYDLDRELAVTALALGTIALLLTLPLWVWLFSGT